jgi:glutathione S-transferase
MYMVFIGDTVSQQDLHLYHGAISTASQRVRLLLAELNLSYTSHLVDMLKQEHVDDTYLAINPKGLLPALDDACNVVVESNEILIYLDDTYGDKRFQPMTAERLDAQRTLMTLASDLHGYSKYLYYEFLFKPLVRKTQQQMQEFEKQQQDKKLVAFHKALSENGGFDEEQLLSAFRSVEVILDVVEDQLSADEYLLGGDVQLADLSLFPNIYRLQRMGYPLQQRKRIRGWLTSMKKRASYRTAIAAFEPLRLQIFCTSYRLFRRVRGDSIFHLAVRA